MDFEIETFKFVFKFIIRNNWRNSFNNDLEDTIGGIKRRKFDILCQKGFMD